MFKNNKNSWMKQEGVSKQTKSGENSFVGIKIGKNILMQ